MLISGRFSSTSTSTVRQGGLSTSTRGGVFWGGLFCVTRARARTRTRFGPGLRGCLLAGGCSGGGRGDGGGGSAVDDVEFDGIGAVFCAVVVDGDFFTGVDIAEGAELFDLSSGVVVAGVW